MTMHTQVWQIDRNFQSIKKINNNSFSNNYTIESAIHDTHDVFGVIKSK